MFDVFYQVSMLTRRKPPLGETGARRTTLTCAIRLPPCPCNLHWVKNTSLQLMYLFIHTTWAVVSGQIQKLILSQGTSILCSKFISHIWASLFYYFISRPSFEPTCNHIDTISVKGAKSNVGYRCADELPRPREFLIYIAIC